VQSDTPSVPVCRLHRLRRLRLTKTSYLSCSPETLFTCAIMTTLTRGAAVSQTEVLPIQQELLRAVSRRGAQTRARGDGASQRRSRWLLLSRHAAVLRCGRFGSGRGIGTAFRCCSTHSLQVVPRIYTTRAQLLVERWTACCTVRPIRWEDHPRGRSRAESIKTAFCGSILGAESNFVEL